MVQHCYLFSQSVLIIHLSYEQDSRMASKTNKKYQRELDITHDPKKKNTYDPCQQKIRVIQHNLVFVSGLPSDLATEAMLSNDLYFGRYGKITKIITNNGQNTKKSQTCQAYITYNNQLEASTAIIALDGFTLESRPLKASYGTTKYCTHFLKNYQCQNSECFYLHHLEKDNEVPNKSDPRTISIDKNDQAFTLVCSNIERIIEKIVELGEDQCENQQGFPNLMQMVDFLIDSKLVSSAVVETLINKYKNILRMPKQSDSTHQSKKSKSNSFSTIASPNKQQRQLENQLVSQSSQIKQKQKQKQKQNEKIQLISKDRTKTQQINLQNNNNSSKTQKPQKLEKQKEEQKQKNTTNNITQTHQQEIIQNNQVSNSEQLEKTIEKLIIRNILNKNNNKSKMSFVSQKSDKQMEASNSKQLQKIKSIIEKHLIASN